MSDGYFVGRPEPPSSGGDYYVGRPASTPGDYFIGQPTPAAQDQGYYFIGRPASSSTPEDNFIVPESDFGYLNIKVSPGVLESQAERIIDVLRAKSERSILPILGLGGIGKTKLARLVFDHTEFQDYSKAWVDVSKKFNLHAIAKSIISDLPGKECQLVANKEPPRNQLFLQVSNDKVQVKNLRENIVAGGQKKVLIVLDGLWEENDSMLDDMMDMLDIGKNVIVLVTTRSLYIARKICTMEPHKLNADKCWQITKLQETSPADSITRHVFRSLKETYDRMEQKLKACFEYCAIFPDGRHIIIKDDLIHQWISLDLIKPYEQFTLQQVGEMNIRKLLDVSFLQPENSALDNEKSILYTMHDVVRALARSVAADKLIVWDGKNSSIPPKKYCPYALVTNFGMISTKLSSTLSDEIKAIHFLGCGSKKDVSDDSLSFAKNLCVLQFSQLSKQRLPASICRLKKLKHLNLSRCGELVQLPKSFGDLTNLVHINLSRCFGLLKLPESFVDLKNLLHLDLSFCACFQGLSIVLRGLNKLEHLNLSQPCCYPTKDNRSYLMDLKGVWEHITKLRYLNLSMFLNPIFRHMTEKEREAYLEKLDCLTSLEHLDLSHNIFLFHLPERLNKLTNLLTLDLSGCIRLKSIDRWVSEVKSLKVVELRNCRALDTYEFVVHTDDGENSSSIVRLEDVSSRVLEISCLENVKSVAESKRIKLVNKRNLMKLGLGWMSADRLMGCVQDQDLLAALVPPRDLQIFKLHGYHGAIFPAWLTKDIYLHLPNLVEVILEAIPRWSSLEPFGLLPNLERLTLKKMASITRIDLGDQSGGNGAAFRKLSELTLDDLKNLDVFMEAHNSGDQRTIYALVIQKCPKLRFETCPPKAKMLLISDCKQLVSSWVKRVGGRDTVDQDPSSSTSTASARVTELVIEVPLDELNWKKLDKLPPPDSLHIKNCDDRIISQDIMTDIKKVIDPIKSLRFSRCDSMTSLPSFLKDLASLSELVIHECPVLKSLPLEMVQNPNKLKSLSIGGCPELENWCEAEKNKEKLARFNITLQ